MQAEPASLGQGLALSSFFARGLGDVPLFYAACLFAMGIALTKVLSFQSSVVLLALAAAGCVCVLAACRTPRLVSLPLATMGCLLGTWCALMEPQAAADAPLAAISDGLARTVEGTIVAVGPIRFDADPNLLDPAHPDPSLTRPASQRIDIRLSSVELVSDQADVQAPMAGEVRLTVRWPSQTGENPFLDREAHAFRCGEQVRAVARLLQPETYHDPGVWNPEQFLVGQGITATSSVNADRIERVASSSASWVCRLGVWQHAASERLLGLPQSMRALPAGLRLSPADAAMLAAMVTGDRTYLTHSLRVGFERTGSFHMLVVSGFHLAIVTGCVFWVARRLRLPRVFTTLITLAASIVYALFTGFATPVQRSLWMVMLYLVGHLLFRERSPLNTIGFAALCLLAASPASLFDASLQMTLLAVLAIAGVAAPLLAQTIHPYVIATRDLTRTQTDVNLPSRHAQFRVTLRVFVAAFESTRGESMARRAIPFSVRLCLRSVELLVVSCIVEMVMTLPMALYFHRITLFALPVNLFLVPLLLFLMPAALVTLVTAAAWPPAAAIPAVFVALPLHFGTWLVRQFGAQPLGDLRIPPPLLGRSLLFCACLAAAMVLTRGSRWPRRVAWATLFLAVLAAVVPRAVRHPRDALLVEAIDVGQGDSLLLITPDGKTLLLDGGGFGGAQHRAQESFDIGEQVVSEALWARGIRHLDVVALSHAHSDHMGGLPAVLRNFRPAELWVGNNPSSPDYDALLNEAAQLGVRVRSFRAGDASILGVAQIAVLAPFADYQPGAEAANNDSLVLHVAYGATSVLLEGDAEGPVEQAMLAEPGLPSTLLKVGHHGSVTSPGSEFLARVAPQWAVISCGLHNRYGHPRQEVLQALEAAKVRTYSTDINGAACFLLNGQTVTPDAACGWEQKP